MTGRCKKVIDIPAEPADPALLPPALKAFKAVPPLVTEIALSTDDKYLYAACFGTGELRQYDVSDPFSPKFNGAVRFGGVATTRAASEGRRRSTAARRCSKSAATASAST